MDDLQPEAHAEMSLHPFEHEAAPPEERKLVRSPAVVARGVGLGALAAGFAGLAAIAMRKFGWFGAPAGVAGAAGALLSGWAALIHLTGGEKFDDHRWI